MKPVIVYESSFTRYFNLDGLVLYPFVLISDKEEDALPSVMKHELMHVKQVDRDGFCRFYGKYFGHILKCIAVGDIEGAFTSNDYEVEAYGIEMTALNADDIKMSGWKGCKNDKEHIKEKKSRKKRNKNEIKTK